MDELQGEHDCKIIERFRNLPLSDTINACKEWENTPTEQRAARLQRLHRDAQIFNALFYPGGDVVFLMPDCNQGQPPNEQTVNPTNESSESESSEGSSSEDSGDDGDSEDDDDESEEDALTCLGLVGTFCYYRYFILASAATATVS